MPVQMSFWGDYCISVEENPQGSGRWFYTVALLPGRAMAATDPGESPPKGPFASDTAALETARLELVKTKQAY